MPKPALSVQGYFVNDSAGNTNGCLNPGETAHLVVRITNSDYRAENVVGVLTSASPHLSLSPAPVLVGTIEKNASAHNGARPFCIGVSTGAPAKSVYPLDLALSYDGCVETNHYLITIGGYSCNGSAPFSWTDTTGGTSLMPMGLLSYKTVSLPFPFGFYGKTYNTVHVTSNGQLLFETASGSYYNNTGIPDSGVPNAMIAAYWDLFDPSAGGTIRHRTFGVAPNRYWVVEWNAVPFYWAVGTATFEAVLHEDGRIGFYYGPSSGTDMEGAECTIGIEDSWGRVGSMFSWNEPGAVTNGMAILYTVTEPASDGDGDGLPDSFETLFFGGTGGGGAGDTDGDGVSDRNELRCGTDPADSQSFLRLNPLPSAQAGKCVLQWPCVPGMAYVVQGCTNLPSGLWTNVSGQAVTGAVTCTGVYTAGVHSAGGTFYRLRMP